MEPWFQQVNARANFCHNRDPQSNLMDGNPELFFPSYELIHEIQENFHQGKIKCYKVARHTLLF